MDIEKIIRNVLSDGKEEPCIFDRIVEEIQKFNENPVHNYTEMRQRDNKHIKGLAWEQFCQWYLLNVPKVVSKEQNEKKYEKVWLWKEIPDDVKASLGLTMRTDNGIDIVAKLSSNNNKERYVAVQCKFKKRQIAKGRKTVKVTWKTLSTFLGLTARTNENGWEQHIVMTNCDGVGKWEIPRTSKDKTIAYGTFKKLSRTDCSSQGMSLNSETSSNINTKPKTMEELRAARIAAFEK